MKILERLGIKKNLNKLASRLGLKKTQRKALNNKKSQKPKTKSAYDRMSDEERREAEFANASYTAPEKRGDMGDFKYDKDLSDLRTAVYHNPKTKQTKMSLRGTDFSDKQDVLTDVAITAGKQKNTRLFKKDQKDFEKVKKKYGSNISVGGHSLGGQRSYALAKRNNVKASAFNMGTGIDREGVTDKLRCSNPIKSLRPKFCNKIKKHHVFGDGLSVMSRLSAGNNKQYSAGTLDPRKTHSMSNFLKPKKSLGKSGYSS